MAQASEPVGVVGLGLIGSVLAGRLLDAGFAVTGADLDPERLRALEAKGGRGADLPDLVETCPIIVLALFDTAQVVSVVENAVAGRDRTVVCTSTCDPDEIAALAARVGPRGVSFLESPISGTSEQVRAGQGVALLGGEAALVERCRPVLHALFATLHHVGRVGDGGRAKLAVNLILGLNRLALAEGLVFAEGLGLAPERFLPVARASAAYSQCMDTKGPKMVSGDFSAQGKIAQSLKDFGLMLDAARRAGQPLALASLNVEILRGCLAAGEGELDNSAVIRELRRRGG